MDKAELNRLIEEATRTGVLDLSSNQLTSVPPELAQLNNLTELDLSSNQLSNYPTRSFGSRDSSNLGAFTGTTSCRPAPMDF